MISRVIFIGDPHRGEQAINIIKVQGLFAPVLRQLGIDVETFITEINQNTNRDVWIPVWKSSLATYPEPATSSIDLHGAAVIGFETPETELAYLSENNVPWINLCIHPLRFLDDLYFEVTTSFSYAMQSNSASMGLIDLCVETFSQKCVSRSRQSTPKTLLICGQDWIDKSIYFDGGFRQINDYIPQLDVIVKQYERVLYKPHPAHESAEIAELVTQRYQAHLCNNTNIYELFVAEGIDTVCAISSSVLTEAPCFGIQSIFLESRAKRYGAAISYRALLDDCDFWEIAFLGREKAQNILKLSPAVPSNYLRRMFFSWGFVTDEMRLDARLSQLEVRATHAETKAQQAEAKVEQAEIAAAHLELRLSQVEVRATHAETKAQQAEIAAANWKTQANEWHERLLALHASTSWTITKPLRAIKRLIKGDFAVFGRVVAVLKVKIKQALRPLVAFGIAYVNKKPALRHQLKRTVAKFPTLHQRLLRVAMNTGAHNSAHLPASFTQRALSRELHGMTPRARQIQHDLKAAIEKNKEHE
jgi:uncharacterized membrane protein